MKNATLFSKDSITPFMSHAPLGRAHRFVTLITPYIHSCILLWTDKVRTVF